MRQILVHSLKLNYKLRSQPHKHNTKCVSRINKPTLEYTVDSILQDFNNHFHGLDVNGSLLGLPVPTIISSSE